MSIHDKIRSGGVSIRDIKPEIDSEGKARSNGFVEFPLHIVVSQIYTLEQIWGGMEQVLSAFEGVHNYARRLYNTRDAINEFVENYQSQPETKPPNQ